MTFKRITYTFIWLGPWGIGLSQPHNHSATLVQALTLLDVVTDKAGRYMVPQVSMDTRRNTVKVQVCAILSF